MSEVMTCMPFEQLMNWVLEEKKTKGTVFGQHRAYAAETDRKLNIFERNLETPIGPAAGPHTQLTQNIVASYYAGARFFELKTVQKMDGAELAACINMFIISNGWTESLIKFGKMVFTYSTSRSMSIRYGLPAAAEKHWYGESPKIGRAHV